MNIPRIDLAEAFGRFVGAGNGIVIGPPGVGKTFLLTQYAKPHVDAGSLVIYLPIDKLNVDTESDLADIMGIKGDLINYLRNAILERRPNIPAVLLFDAFDAARSDKSRRLYLSIMKRVISTPGEAWNVVVSARTYDAKRSEELLELFPQSGQDKPPDEYQMHDVHCRHFCVPRLTPEEVRTTAKGIPGLADSYAQGSEDFKELLRIPFNLQLTEKLIERGTSLSELSTIGSEVELLDLFWKQRVTDHGLSEDFNLILSKVTRSMVDHRALSIRREEVYEVETREAWQSLLSQEILEIESPPSQQLVHFEHNILFDFAVAVLLVEDRVPEFERFVTEDPARPFFLRPSLSYFFARLWHKAPDRFWKIFWFTMSIEDAPHLRLLARLLPPSAIALEAASPKELEPLVEALAQSNSAAPMAISYVLQAIKALDIRRDDLWAQFHAQLARNLDEAFIVELVIATSDILSRAQGSEIDLIEQLSGQASRAVLRWVWDHRHSGVKSVNVDALAGRQVVPLVARTFAQSPEESREMLINVLSLINEPNFPIEYLFGLTDNLQSIWESDPEFALLTYQKIFGFTEVSREATPFGGIVLPLSSTRRQDYELCRYTLQQAFPKFLRAHPLWAAKAAIDSLNSVIFKEHVLRYQTQSLDPDKVDIDPKLYRSLIDKGLADIFSFRGEISAYVADHSELWGIQSHLDSVYQMANELFGYLEHLASTESVSELDQILDILRDRALVAYFWRRLLETASRYPKVFASRIVDLCTAKPILTGNEALRELGLYLEACSSELDTRTLGEIEKAIMELPSHVDNPDLLEKFEHRRDRLLGRIPVDLLQRDDARQIRLQMEALQQIPPNDPLASWTEWGHSITEDEILAEQGADVSSPRNQTLRLLSRKLEEFTKESQNKIPQIEVVEEIIPDAQQLWENLINGPQADRAVIDSAWTHLAAGAHAMARGVIQLTDDEFAFSRKVLLRAATSSIPIFEPEYAANYDFPSWSPSPRTEAAQGLPWLAIRQPDPEIGVAIENLVHDPMPSVRFLVVAELWRIRESNPDVFWRLLADVADNERNRVVLQALCSSLGNIQGHPQVVDILSRLLQREQTEELAPEVSDGLVQIVAWLCFARENDWAVQRVSAYLQEPTKASRQIERMVLSVMTAVTPQALTEPRQSIIAKKIVDWLPLAIDSANKGIAEMLSVAQLTEEQQGIMQELFRIIDNVISHLYFAQKAESTTAEMRQRFYALIKPVLRHILESTKGDQAGVILAPTAHHFMQLLNDMLRFDPEEVLHMATALTISSQASRYHLDPLAIREVVKLVETFLADHRDILQKDMPLQDLLGLLDIFANAGWPDALRLVWQLDEIFR